MPDADSVENSGTARDKLQKELAGKDLKEVLERQQYGITGKHSAVKICTWTKKSLRDEGYCYKQKFYGIRSHLCCQITPSLNYCHNRCVFCWRPTEYTKEIYFKAEDEPKDIIRNSIQMQRKLLSGFGGLDRTDMQKFSDAKEPMHFAISLSGEPMLYDKLNDLIRELHELGKTTFVVTNGMEPERLLAIEPPTQLYLSVDAPEKELFEKIDLPQVKDGWERLQKSLAAMKFLKQKTRTTLRFTLIKGLNMEDPKGWADAIKAADPLFVEVKAYMFVGFSRLRLNMENMPRHNEVRDFAQKICKNTQGWDGGGYRIIDEKEESRVVLLAKDDFTGRIMEF